MRIELKIYRHKEYQDVYLLRNYALVGGNADSEWYSATRELKDAIRNANFVGENNRFEERFRVFGEPTKVKIVDEKDFEFNGYKGKLKKEITLLVTDFEKVIIREVDADED